MSYEIRNEDGTNVGYIDVNGRQACILYDPKSSPMRPFEKIEDLEAYVQSVHVELEAMPAIEPEEAISVGRISWRPDIFWRRFTPEEQVLLISAAKENPVVESFRMHLLMTPVVNSDDKVTQAGMSYLVQASLLTELRKNEILGGE